MNCKEHHLPELELATGQVREALQAILHTILFIRSPGPVAPCDVHCEGFDLTYTRIANDATNKSSSSAGGSPSSQQNNNVGNDNSKKKTQQHYLDQKVDDSIESFLRTLTQIGPELLSGCLTLSFFERRASKQLFGLVSHEEKVVWEQWVLHVVVNNTPRPVNDDSASVMERQRIQDTAEGMLRSVLMKIYDSASSGDNLDYIPPVMYEFEIRCSKRADDRENMYSRVANMPALLNLDGS
jgi:autophagy-related protein 101